MKTAFALLTSASLAALANAHGYFVTPTARQPGTAFQDACGMQAYYQMEGDINGNIQGLEQTTQNQPDYKPKECHLWKCKPLPPSHRNLLSGLCRWKVVVALAMLIVYV